MDPCTALAVAGNILQFIQFVGGLLNSARQIHASPAGISVSGDHVQDVCSALVDFGARLQPPPGESQEHLDSGQKGSQHAHVLLECAAACSTDCEELIRITEKLKVKAGSKPTRCWRSFQAALAEVWKSSEIEDLRRRVADRQRLMILQLCAVSRFVPPRRRNLRAPVLMGPSARTSRESVGRSRSSKADAES
jgi:hypothetical protein